MPNPPGGKHPGRLARTAVSLDGDPWIVVSEFLSMEAVATSNPPSLSKTPAHRLHVREVTTAWVGIFTEFQLGYHEQGRGPMGNLL